MYVRENAIFLFVFFHPEGIHSIIIAVQCSFSIYTVTLIYGIYAQK